MNNKCQETGQEGYEGTEEIMAGKPSLEDREMVQDLSEEDCTQREIGALVNRSQNNVSGIIREDRLPESVRKSCLNRRRKT